MSTHPRQVMVLAARNKIAKHYKERQKPKPMFEGEEESCLSISLLCVTCNQEINLIHIFIYEMLYKDNTPDQKV